MPRLLSRPLAVLTALAATALAGCERSTAEPAHLQATPIRARDGRPPATPAAFDSTGCPYMAASYRPHPRDAGPEDVYAYRMRFMAAAEPDFIRDRHAIIDIRERGGGRLLTQLRLDVTWSNGFSQPYVLMGRDDAISSQMVWLNRDLSKHVDGKTEGNAWLAPYVIFFPELARELYYLHGNWAVLADDAAYHTTERHITAKVPDLWLLERCSS